MPQHLLNEIHGAWFDPSNPVVAMSGSLRGDLFADLIECERRTDLVVTVGSSLNVMNADLLVVTSARRSRQDREWLRSLASVDEEGGVEDNPASDFHEECGDDRSKNSN